MVSVGSIVDSVIDEISSILVEQAKSVLPEKIRLFQNMISDPSPRFSHPLPSLLLEGFAEIWKCLTRLVTSLCREHQNKIEPDKGAISRWELADADARVEGECSAFPPNS
jgi:hypothetical protein